MKEKRHKKAPYIPPTIKVTKVEVEGIMAASANPTITLQDWILDDTPQAEFDGDIWFPM